MLVSVLQETNVLVVHVGDFVTTGTNAGCGLELGIAANWVVTGKSLIGFARISRRKELLRNG